MIAVCILAAIALIAGAIVCAPFMLQASWQLDEGKTAYDAAVWWFAPWVFQARLARRGGDFEVRIFGRRWGKQPADAGTDQPPHEPAPSPSEKELAALEDFQPPLFEKAGAPAPVIPPPPIDESATAGQPSEETPRRESRGEEAAPHTPAPQPRGLRARWQRLKAMKKSRLALKLALDARVRKGTALWILRTLKAMRTVIHFHALRLHVTANLLDPALTGAAYGCCQGAHYALMNTGKGPIDLCFKPVFDRQLLAVAGHARLSTSLMRVSWPLLVAAAILPYLSVIRVLWRETNAP